ncbi:MAG: hypothetical protein GX366_07240 [Epulopiscium sp.]|nr:hypothetical protein [Candidatus Epulonipiscium sp.]
MKAIIKIIQDPYAILFFSVIVLMIARYVFKLEYINCFDIINEYINCFRNKDKILWLPILIYFILPMPISYAISKVQLIDDDAINIITIIVSILTSMFFTLLAMILDMNSKVKDNSGLSASEAHILKKLLKETYYSVMFEIMLSIILLIMCFVYLFTDQINGIVSIIIYYLLFTLVVNLFMLLKRIFKVAEKHLE